MEPDITPVATPLSREFEISSQEFNLKTVILRAGHTVLSLLSLIREISSMVRQFLVIALLLLGAVAAPAQKKKGTDKQLETFWKSKHIRASAIARAVIFKAGDTIADIGTADGWFAAALSMYGDRLTFYLEDIDSTLWNADKFDLAFQYFSRINQKQVTHQFHYVTGTAKSTGLPHHIFDKVLIIDTYHHFTHRDDMLTDAINLLKPDGKIVIMEALARRPGDFHQGCKTPIYLEQEIISHMAAHQMKLESVRLIHKVAGRKNKLLIFVKN